MPGWDRCGDRPPLRPGLDLFLSLSHSLSLFLSLFVSVTQARKLVRSAARVLLGPGGTGALSDAASDATLVGLLPPGGVGGATDSLSFDADKDLPPRISAALLAVNAAVERLRVLAASVDAARSGLGEAIATAHSHARGVDAVAALASQLPVVGESTVAALVEVPIPAALASSLQSAWALAGSLRGDVQKLRGPAEEQRLSAGGGGDGSASAVAPPGDEVGGGFLSGFVASVLHLLDAELGRAADAAAALAPPVQDASAGLGAPGLLADEPAAMCIDDGDSEPLRPGASAAASAAVAADAFPACASLVEEMLLATQAIVRRQEAGVGAGGEAAEPLESGQDSSIAALAPEGGAAAAADADDDDGATYPRLLAQHALLVQLLQVRRPCSPCARCSPRTIVLPSPHRPSIAGPASSACRGRREVRTAALLLGPAAPRVPARAAVRPAAALGGRGARLPRPPRSPARVDGPLQPALHGRLP